MSDRQLLESAARAARIALVFDPEAPVSGHSPRISGGRYWNPLTDDGDALRLGAKVGMRLEYRKVVGSATGEVAVSAAGHRIVEGYRDDYMTATRRAIVRAAAAIGAEPPASGADTPKSPL